MADISARTLIQEYSILHTSSENVCASIHVTGSSGVVRSRKTIFSPAEDTSEASSAFVAIGDSVPDPKSLDMTVGLTVGMLRIGVGVRDGVSSESEVP